MGGAYNAAMQDCGEALKLDPGCAAAWTLRGGAKMRVNDLQGAQADCDRALDLDNSLALAWATRAVARLNQGDATGAAADATRALELDPTNKDASRVLAQTRKNS